MHENALAFLLNSKQAGQPIIERTLLRDQAIGVLRDHIVAGRIPPGTKIVEREVAELLKISRAPVRDALLELEKEGLLETRPDGRYVIELTERDIRELYQVRLALEKLAAQLAAKHTTPANQAALSAKLEEMREAIARGDQTTHVAADVAMHWLIWKQADNRHLFRMLSSLIGPVFMFVANNAEAFDWNETLDLHEDLVNCINAGDAEAASTSIERHLDNALHRSLQAMRNRGQGKRSSPR